jgi:uncharacterized protein (TIGR00255 family)
MRSMTGFGSSTLEAPSGTFAWEIRSVNHRTLKVSLRLPPALLGREPEFEAVVQEALGRGAVHATLRLRRASPAPESLVDTTLARAYAEALAELSRELGVPGDPDLRLIAALPGVLRVGGTSTAEDSEAMAKAAAEGLRAALASLTTSRTKEGATLRRDFEARLRRVAAALSKIGKRAPKIADAARRRLAKRLKDLLEEHPGQALEEAVAREVVLLAQRADIAEEATRLGTHLGAFRAAMAAGDEVGRRLDFLLQEMLRETNTIGSKSQDAAVAACVVDMKVEIDRMKEQAANVE